MYRIKIYFCFIVVVATIINSWLIQSDNIGFYLLMCVFLYGWLSVANNAAAFILNREYDNKYHSFIENPNFKDKLIKLLKEREKND